MTAKAQQVRVGMFAAVTLALAALVLIVFGGLRFWEHSDRYPIEFEGSVIGLEPGAEVYLNGLKVGSVEDMRVAPDDVRRVRVTIKLKHGVPIHADTKALLQLAGLTGLKIIDLREGTQQARLLNPGEPIAPGQGMLDKLEAQAQVIVDRTTAVMTDADDVLKGAKGVMQRVDKLTDGLTQLGEPAQAAAQNLVALTGSLKLMVDENRVGLRQTLASIKQTANGANALLDDQIAPLFAGAGDVVTEMRKLLVANEGPLRAAMFDLRQASRNFKELSRDVRQKPSRLLFSSAPQERQMP